MLQLSKEDINELKRFNRNVEWLKRAGLSSIVKPAQDIKVVKQEDWLTVKEATKFVGRSRSWLQRITITVPGIECTTGAPMMQLYKGMDWKRETSRILYKKDSLENLKKEMEKAGDRFDERLAEKAV